MLSTVSAHLKLTWMGLVIWVLIIMSTVPALCTIAPTLAKINLQLIKTFQ